MRVLATSNFDDETFSEYFVKELDERNDEYMQMWCNSQNHEKSDVFYKVVLLDTIPYTWEP